MSNDIFDPMEAAAFVVGRVSHPEAIRVYDGDMASLDSELTTWYDGELSILRQYAVLAENPADLNDEHRRTDLLAKLSFGLRRSGDVLAYLKGQLRKAETNVKRSASVAGMDDLTEHVAQLTAKGEKIRITDDYRKSFISGSDRTYNANLRCAMIIAMTEQVWTMKTEFMMAISTVKAIAWGMKDSEHMSGAASAPLE